MKLKYHLQAKKGWINDPNGLTFYKGKIHAFYQHNPYDVKWDTMHWGHATSKDFINWKNQEIALTPNEEYENKFGCFSGSGIVAKDKHYLFYTGVSEKYGQAQCLAIGDGKKYTKYEKNPIITSPLKDNKDFRDPKVFTYKNKYYMVVGAQEDGFGRILLYTSTNLLDWEYLGILYESNDFCECLECPDFFPLNDKWVLIFGVWKPQVEKQVFVIGTFDGKTFTQEKTCYPILGTDFYAGQTFEYNGKRILMGWLYHHGREVEKGEKTAGALSIPCEITLENNQLKIYPVDNAKKLLKTKCE